MAEVIAIANQKGGVGKTTTSVNLAAALAHFGQETLLLDLDPQANATSGLGFEKTKVAPTTYEVLMGEVYPEKATKPTAMEYLDIICSTNDLVSSEIELVTSFARESRLKHALEHIQDVYQFIIIDCPPSLSLLTVNALAASNKVIIPIQCEYYALEGLASFLNTIEKLKLAVNPGLDIEGILMTMYDARISLGNQVRGEVEKFFKGSFFRTIIPRNIRLAEAPSFGQTIIQYDIKSKGAEAYLDLAQEFLDKRGIILAHNGEKTMEPAMSGETI